MDVLTYEYQGKAIEFLMGDDLMINATEMAAVFGKEVYEFLRLKTTINLIDAIKKRAIGDKKTGDYPDYLSGIKGFDPENMVVTGNGTVLLVTIPVKEHGGTWMHRWLAIDFAMWLDIDFKLWVLERIDYLFINFSKAHRELVIKEGTLLRERKKLLNDNADNPLLKKLAIVDDQLKDIRNKKTSATRSTYKEWKLDI